MVTKQLIFLACVASCSTYFLRQQEQSASLEELRLVNSTLDKVLKGDIQKWGSKAKCFACEVVVEALQLLVRSNVSTHEIAKLITEACNLFHVETERVCLLVTQEFKEEFVTVGFRLLLHPEWLCYAALGETCGEPANLFPFWNVTLPATPKPKPKPLVKPQEGYPTLKVVQLSDVHIDLQYKPGTSVKCNEPLCCRELVPSKMSKKAGFWGTLDGPCDTPLHTFVNALEHIRDNIKPDIVFWTGDIPAHDVWDQPREKQLHHIHLTADLVSQYLPNTLVLPSLGNHESAPVDSFPPPGITDEHLSNAWLNTFIQKIWSRWVPPESLDTIGYGGFYAMQYSPKLRIVSLNTQYCDTLNFWLYLNNTDPAGQLAWLVNELTWAEMLDVKVIILGHIPTGAGDCFKAFSWNYYKIIDRFEATVVGQYVGHTHKDEYKLMFTEEPDHHPTGLVFISPSLTTFSGLRPSFRVYTLDGVYEGSTYRPLDTATYLLDLEKANKDNETVWELEYTAAKAYNITWITPDTMYSVYKRMAADPSFFFDTYYYFKYHTVVEGLSCDEKCYSNTLCDIVTGRSHDPSACPSLSHTARLQHFNKDKMC